MAAPGPPDRVADDGWSATQVLEALSTAVIVLHDDLRIAYLNPAAETLLACSQARAAGRTLAGIMRDPGELCALAERAVGGGGPYVRRELLLGTLEREHLVDCRVDVTSAGDVVLVELLDAETRVQRDRETALLAQQSVGRAMGRQLAHEIRNPLAGLRGAAQLLQRRLAGEYRDHTRILIDETDRLSALVERVLGPERPSERAEVNLHRLMHRVFELLEHDAGAGVTIVEDYDPSLPPLALDADQVMQALLNLGRNGLQALAGQGTLRLRTRVESGYLLRGHRYSLVARIDFEDDGPGVPEEIVDTLFYPLVTGRADGTGIGLALAQELLNRHDGLVQLRSARGPTLFSVYLPVSR